MLQLHHPEMIVKAASLVKTGKAYAPRELHGDVARVVRPCAFRRAGHSGARWVRSGGGDDRDLRPEALSGRGQLHRQHNHTGCIWTRSRNILPGERAVQQHAAAKPAGTEHGDAASVSSWRPRRAARRREIQKSDPLPVDYWITLEDLQNTAKAQNVEIRKGDILLVPDGLAQDVGRARTPPGVSMRRTRSASTTTRHRADSLKFFNDMDIVAAARTTRRWSGDSRQTRSISEGLRYLALAIHTDSSGTAAPNHGDPQLDELAKDRRTSSLRLVHCCCAAGIGVPINPIAIR